MGKENFSAKAEMRKQASRRIGVGIIVECGMMQRQSFEEETIKIQSIWRVEVAGNWRKDTVHTFRGGCCLAIMMTTRFCRMRHRFTLIRQGVSRDGG
jgi:hypothetical protein